jgi:hypothetical protein
MSSSSSSPPSSSPSPPSSSPSSSPSSPSSSSTSSSSSSSSSPSSSSSSSSSVGATTLGGFWPALRFHSIISYLYTSLSLQFLTFISFKSSSTCSNHLSLGRPTGLDKHGSHSVNFLTVLVESILITCAAQHYMCCPT